MWNSKRLRVASLVISPNLFQIIYQNWQLATRNPQLVQQILPTLQKEFITKD